MKLTKLTYQDPYWELNNLALRDVNLVVGRNSTGKSRTLSTIDLLVKMINQRRSLNWGSRWDIEFVNQSEDIIQFNFATKFIEEGKVSAEFISVNGDSVLFRYKDGSVHIKNKVTNNNEVVFPPENKLTLHTNRDVRKYPFLEDIANWADQSFGFKFGNISPFAMLNQQEYDLLTAVEDIPTLFKQLNRESKIRVQEDFNSIGYDISGISIQDRSDMPILFVKENNIAKAIPHFKLSQGMFRTLAVIIYVEYLINRKRPATLIIDDLCEGLDYDRATRLGRLIFDKCIDRQIQLITTSNDSFLMDAIDIEYWTILTRQGKTVEAMNRMTNSEIFDRFRFTGLSNFDFFSSDYILQ